MAELLIDETESQAPTRAIATVQPEPLNPLMLMQQAIDRGVDPAALKQLVDLQEQWRAARAKEAFSAAMNAVQIEMPCVVRDATNSKTNTPYIRLETLTHRAKPIYTAHGFSLSFSETESRRENWHRVTCTVRHIAGHSEQHWIELPTDGIGPQGKPIGGMNAVQGAVSTGTYGQRVLTCRVFNITIADTDLDGAAPNPPISPLAQTAQPRAKRPQPKQESPRDAAIRRIKVTWNGKNGSGDHQRDFDAFWGWWKFHTKSESYPQSNDDWSNDEINACCKALQIEGVSDA